MPEMLYAVHTRTCTYLLDEEGICRWVLSPAGAPAEVSCVGAQFVACLDLRVSGGLVGELLVGASALFVVRSETGRLSLLRTTPIEHVDFRRPADVAEPPPGASEEIDLDELTTYSSEVTRALPLYRPAVERQDVDPRPATPWVPGLHSGKMGS